MSGMSSHQSGRADTTTWLTPPEILEDLGPFDLDPCAAPVPRPWPSAARHITWPTDGLATTWGDDELVWCNPPYGRETWAWLEKLAAHPAGGIALIFARTETAGFVAAVWQQATALFFLHGRLHFHHADGTRARANAGAPSVLVAYGAEAAARLRHSRLPGTFVHLAQRGSASHSASEPIPTFAEERS
ncbi:DNA N-6-adenine-methyltransferase [Leucobacter sp. HY1910]